MQWGSLTEFWAMGGYGFYVGPRSAHGPVHGAGSTRAWRRHAAAGSRDVS
jgi:hypothetical protein